MPNSTQATMALRKLGIAFKLHTYVYDSNAESIGLQAAEALGVDPNRMLKTLMAEVDGKPVCAVVPSDCEVSMKKLAAVLGLSAYHMWLVGYSKALARGERKLSGKKLRMLNEVPGLAAAVIVVMVVLKPF